MPVCDICRKAFDKPTSMVIKHWGGKEERIMLCDTCATRVLIYLNRLVRNKGVHKP